MRSLSALARVVTRHARLSANSLKYGTVLSSHLGVRSSRFSPFEQKRFFSSSIDPGAFMIRFQTVLEKHKPAISEPAHLLYSMLVPGSLTEIILKRAKINMQHLKHEAETYIQNAPQQPQFDITNMKCSYALKQILTIDQSNKSDLEAEALKKMATLDNAFFGPYLSRQNLTPESIADAVHMVKNDKKRPVDNEGAADVSIDEALSKYTVDLTDLASKGKLDRVIGRDREVRRMIEVLSRRTKNNPMLIGDAGVGKTAIVEGLAQRIVAGEVPDTLKNRKILSLDLAALVAGAKFRGEFEERLKGVIEAVTNAQGRIVLFIDEIHTAVGAGQAGSGGMDVANILKPKLARGELRCIGATTTLEYRKYIEKDAALERRFQPIMLEAPSVNDTISILRALRPHYEVFHGVRIRDASLVVAAQLSDRYIHDRNLPDKAIDLVDEAAAHLRMAITSKPSSLDAAERKLMSLEMAIVSLERDEKQSKLTNKEKDQMSTLKEQRDEVKAEVERLTALWAAERGQIEEIRTLKEELQLLKKQLKDAQSAFNLDKVAELSNGAIPSVTAKLKAAEERVETSESSLLRDQVEPEDIAEVVAVWTGIPVSKLVKADRERLLTLQEHLKKRVVGQDDAIEALSDVIQRAKAGLSDPRRPLGSLLFLGPTGVGKTELCRALAGELFDLEVGKEDKGMIRLDMSEYMEKHSVSRLIGAPPGYVGHEDGGQLTEAVRVKPYCVLLFDEIEKAHPDVLNVLLQLLEEGQLTDGKGRHVNFRNCVVIFTSNLGAEILMPSASTKASSFLESLGSSTSSDEHLASANNARAFVEEVLVKLGERMNLSSQADPRALSELVARELPPSCSYKERKQVVKQLIRKQLKPELLNRLDEMVVFETLKQAQIQKIVHLEIQKLRRRMSEQKVDLLIDSDAIDELSEVGYDPQMGARPLRRAIQTSVAAPLARSLLSVNLGAEGAVCRVKLPSGSDTKHTDSEARPFEVEVMVREEGEVDEGENLDV
eukprot:GDKJ01058092.1.p1 GENE.GDKJ01058092.1~~GDKJ01058092.1.p1  ORF type:complete len:1003 (-),score=236.87 GDKJ01058092.1:89-3097(-)